MEKATEKKEALDSSASEIFFRELRGRDEKATVGEDSMHNLWVERKNVPSVLRGLA